MTTNATIKKSLTPYNHANEREVEMMMGKAMCAYANWHKAKSDKYAVRMRDEITAYHSEYEATVRCIAMFVHEGITAICIAVIDRAKSEFGI